MAVSAAGEWPSAPLVRSTHIKEACEATFDQDLTPSLSMLDAARMRADSTPDHPRPFHIKKELVSRRVEMFILLRALAASRGMEKLKDWCYGPFRQSIRYSCM